MVRPREAPLSASGRKASLITARVVPVILFLIVSYVSYVVVGPLGIQYLAHDQRRLDVCIAIVVVWFVLLIPVIASWLRLLLVVLFDPGHIPQLDPDAEDFDKQVAHELAQFHRRNVFVCDNKGSPIWCKACHNYKPDRTHHNQDSGRCTRKMDHFCPWVGGVVGERSFKFFVQFLCYSMILSGYGTTLLAYYVSQDNSKAQWIVALGLATFFSLFTIGMVGNSLWMTFRNVTSIENMNMQPPGHSIHLAVHMPSTQARCPDQKHPWAGKGGDAQPSLVSSEPISQLIGTVTYPSALDPDRPPLPAPEPRTFAILRMSPGTNPWDLGSAWQNFVAVFGSSPIDWILPIRHSPCCDHVAIDSEFPLGPQFQALLFDVDLTSISTESPVVSQDRARRKRVLNEGWKNGERPNGWVLEKEARRLRNEQRRRRERV